MPLGFVPVRLGLAVVLGAGISACGERSERPANDPRLDGGRDSGRPSAADAGSKDAPVDLQALPDAATTVDAAIDSGPSSNNPIGLGPWNGNDNVAPSQRPPGDLPPARVPMFVALGFDDNPEPEPIEWVMTLLSALKNPPGTGKAATYDGTTPRASFFNTSIFTGAAASWKAAHATGFETANHTVNHYHGAGGAMGMNFNQEGWRAEIDGCTTYLTSAAVGARRDQIHGFRTPFGQYNAALFPVLKQLGFWYDCSIDEGYQPDQDGTNFFWPYTLDGGSPGHTNHTHLAPISNWPKGLWELPIYTFIAPPDSEAQRYGAPAGFRSKTGPGGKVTGMDWNLWFDAKLTRAEFTATLKHTLDLRRRGNRAPLLIGMHTKIYAAAGWEPPVNASPTEARAAVADFLAYALSFPEVRIVSYKAVLDWIRNPVPLD